MNKRLTKDKITAQTCLALLICTCVTSHQPVAAQQSKFTATSTPTAVRYRLGPGDKIVVRLFQMEGFDSTVYILPDGTINLPRIGTIYIWGLTIEEARRRLTQAYSNILRRPIVYLDLISARPIRFSVTGEVQRPGIYTLGIQNNQSAVSSQADETTKTSQSIDSQGWPSLVEAIQKAGGITSKGDLRNITLIRSSGNGSAQEIRKINYWESLKSGMPMQNPLVYDGDSIRVPEAESTTESEILATSKSSFAPTTITVNVVGEVKKPGPQFVKPNSPMSHAILAAGDITIRANKQTIQLFRLESNGSITQRQIIYTPGAKLNDASNPPLREGDTLVVDRHLWAKTSDRIKSALEPLGPLVNSASIFKVLAAPF